MFAKKKNIPSASPSINLQNYTQTIFLKFFKLFRVPPRCRLQNHTKTKDAMIGGEIWILNIFIGNTNKYKLASSHLQRNLNPTLCLFHWKTFCKDSFPHFPVFGNTKKTGQWKTIFDQRKTLIKIRLIFYRLFSKNFFWKTISLSHIASPINIIFICSHDKHNFLVPSLSHGKISYFFSPHTLIVTNSGVSASHRSFSLLSFLHVSFPFCNTILWLDFFFPLH